MARRRSRRFLNTEPDIQVPEVSTNTQVKSMFTIEDIPEEALENICKFLRLSDLKSCRLVNSTWKRASFKAARTKCDSKLLVDRTSTWDQAKKLIDRINVAPGSFPSDNFEVKINLYTMFMSTPLIGMFVKATYTWVKELTVSILYISTGLGYQAPPSMRMEKNFRSLKKFTLQLKHGIAGDLHPVELNITDQEVAAIIQYATSFIETAPQLESVALDIGQGIADRRLLPKVIEEIGIGQNLRIRLTSLSLAIRLDDIDWNLMISHNLQLTSLRLYTRMTFAKLLDTHFVKRFLESVSDTLLFLEINDNRNDQQRSHFLTFEFPTMTKLKKLKISSCENMKGQPLRLLKFTNISFKEQFPALEELCLRDLDDYVGTKFFLSPEYPIEPLATLKCLAVSKISNDMYLQPLCVVSQMFPNLKSLHFWPTSDTISQNVVTFLPQLEELSYTTEWGYVQKLFFPEILKQEPDDEEQTHDHSFKSMKNLKILRIEYNGEKPLSGLGFSEDAVELLTEMESLQLLDLSKWPFPLPINEGDWRLLEMISSKFNVLSRYNSAS